MRKSNLTAAIDDVDKIIALLESTQEQIAEGTHLFTPLVILHPPMGARMQPSSCSECSQYKQKPILTRFQWP